MPSTTTPASCDKIKVLLDLKPALDGFAGIPQESRLLFRGLRQLEAFEVEGLIQHGGRRLKGGIGENATTLTTARRVHRLSRLAVSLYREPPKDFFEIAKTDVEGYLSQQALRLKTWMCLAMKPKLFESELFGDFLWRTLFDKTLETEDKALVTSARFRVISASRKQMFRTGVGVLKPPLLPRFPKLDTRDFDCFVAQTPFPGRVSRNTQLIIRYHDSVPLVMPHTIRDRSFHEASHFFALQDNVKSGAHICCISESTRNELLQIFPEAEPNTSVIHDIVSVAYFDEDSHKKLVFQIIRNRLAKPEDTKTKKELFIPVLPRELQEGRESTPFDYLLMVSTIEPRKNHALLIAAWERLRYTEYPNLKLVIVGSQGWDSKPILKAFKPWAERGELFYLSDVPAFELRVLYKHAAATICPSLAEGFDYTGIEAMQSGGITVSSKIPVHHEIYGAASEYFDPYSPENAAQTIARVIAPENTSLREKLRRHGVQIADHYRPENILPQWADFLMSLQR